MSDLISRKYLLDKFKHISVGSWKTVTVGPAYTVWDACRDLIENAPSTESERPIGRWIRNEYGHFECSECNNGVINQPTMMGKPMFDYCPFCGAKMFESADDCIKSCDTCKHYNRKDPNIPFCDLPVDDCECTFHDRWVHI